MTPHPFVPSAKIGQTEGFWLSYTGFIPQMFLLTLAHDVHHGQEYKRTVGTRFQLVWGLRRSFTHITGDSPPEMKIRSILLDFCYTFASSIDMVSKSGTFLNLYFILTHFLPFSKVLHYFNSVLTALPPRNKTALNTLLISDQVVFTAWIYGTCQQAVEIRI